MQTCCYLHAFAPAVTRRRTGIRLGRRRQSRGGVEVPWPSCLFTRHLLINNFLKPISFLERRKHKVQKRGFQKLIAFSVLNGDFHMLTKMTLSQMNPSESLTPCLFNICINIVFHCTPRFLKWSLRITILTKILYTFLISRVCYIPCPSHASWFVHANNVWQKCEAHQMCKLWH
jgi:hypothetical protein